MNREREAFLTTQRNAEVTRYAAMYSIRKQTKVLGEFLGINLKGSSIHIGASWVI
jgi:hypothetical protein